MASRSSSAPTSSSTPTIRSPPSTCCASTGDAPTAAIAESVCAGTCRGGGGPGIRESYELFAQYLDTNVSTPKAVSPFLILMGDEKFYEQIDPTQTKRFLGQDIGQPRDARELWRSLAQRFDIYLLRKSYAGRDEEIRAQWDAVLPPQHIIPVDDPARVVDVAIGLIAQRWGQEADFSKSLKARQDSKGIAKVMESLRVAPNTPTGTGSKLKNPTVGAKSKKLTE